MAEDFVRLEQVEFGWETSAPLLEDVTLDLGPGWTGVVGPNGAGKSTLLALACGRLQPWSGRVSRGGPAVYCPQRTDYPPQDLDRLFAAPGREAALIRSGLGLEPDWPGRWDLLSHGERKRLQIGAALFRDPALLAVDEPSNHLDVRAREVLIQALASFRGVGVLVSHDRELMDRLCTAVIFIDPPRTVLRPGNYSQALGEQIRERTEQDRARSRAAQDLARLEHTWSRRRAEASRAKSRRSKRGLAPRDRDAREKIDRARCSGQDGARGRIQRQIQGRLDQARTRLREMGFVKECPAGIDSFGQRYPGDLLVSLPAGRIPLGPGRVLLHPDLFIRPGDRIGLTGPNGSGKSTLVRALTEKASLPRGRLLYLPQEISGPSSRSILDRARKLRGQDLGWVMNMVSRLGSRPERLLESRLPSPGEVRKLLLALGLREEPWLVILDEPTNHLDLPSIERLETALADTLAALLLVSHDRYFLEPLAEISWRMEPRPPDYLLEVD